MLNKNSKACSSCGAEFSFFKRRTHCRICGNIFCKHCCFEQKLERDEKIKILKEERGDIIKDDLELPEMESTHSPKTNRSVKAHTKHLSSIEP